jgi:hypothetical protein
VSDVPHPHPVDFGSESVQPVLVKLVAIIKSNVTALGPRAVSIAPVGNPLALQYSTTYFVRTPRS